MYHSLKIELPLQSVLLPPPARAGREGGGLAGFEQATFQGSHSSTFTTHSGVLCRVPAATLEVLLLHNSHELRNVSSHLQRDAVTVNDTVKLQDPECTWLVFQ